ncbi:uncharacterized protein LOC131636381 [Vicia villosa]|uniref:uncharacterized protein LOC131636381 n=1 Tax=Vicia villosa TaxID=3911 RepID=UPI00273AC0AC|nr:uncharacterized protein LOC131636381 [Vicia villosa]
MARPFDKISEINETNALWKLAVRIQHKWKVATSNLEHFEMVVIDKMGHDVHVVVSSMLMKSFDAVLLVDINYVIGVVDEVGYTQKKMGGKKAQVNLILRDLGNNTLHCTLWEGYVTIYSTSNKRISGKYT